MKSRWNFQKIWHALIRLLDDQGRLDWSEAFIDGSFASAKKRGFCVGKTKRGKGTKWMAIVDGHGLPVGITVHSATPFETKLVKETVESIPVDRRPEKLIGDKAYSIFPLAQLLQEKFEIELIAPIKSNVKHPWRDSRKLRRYQKRWKVERLFAWFGNYRRLPIRWERNVDNYFGFIPLACIEILWMQL